MRSTTTRWQGQWRDGVRDALTLTPMNPQQMRVHYWRNLDVDYQRAERQFDAIATISTTQPLGLEWTLTDDPQHGEMHLVYQAQEEKMTLHYQSDEQSGASRPVS